jgi:DNA-binding response OmpR family regulator
VKMELNRGNDAMLDKVLVVDDELAIRELLDIFLTGEEYEVILASNGEEALELVEKEQPKAVLLDIKMPGINGIEVCRRLKAKDESKFIPIIMITASMDHRTEAVEAGADDIVTKPFNMEQLSFRLKSALRTRYLSAELERAMS